METLTSKKYKWIWIVILTIATLGLVVSSFLPYFFM